MTPTHAAPPSHKGVSPALWRLLAIALLAVSTFVPFMILVLQSASGSWRWPSLLPNGFTLAAWRSVWGGAIGHAAFTSTLLALATAITAVCVALPIGRSLAQLRGPSRHLAAALVFLPVAAPPIALAAGLQIAMLWLGVGGTSAGVWLAHCVPAIGYVALLFLGVFTSRGNDDIETARSHGATRWQAWRLVLLPSLRAPIAEALAIAFLISWAQVALTLVVGGGAVRALPIEVLSLVRAGQDREAAVGALLLIVPAVAALAALRVGVRRTDALPG